MAELKSKGVQVGAMWVHQVAQEDVLIGTLEMRIIIVRNKLKRSSRSPDYLVYCKDQGYFLPNNVRKKNEKQNAKDAKELVKGRGSEEGRGSSGTSEPEERFETEHEYRPEAGTNEPKSFL